MGEDYLNCGNAELEKGAEEWAYSKGYSIFTSAATGETPLWGSNQ